MDITDIDHLQTNLNILGERAIKNEIKINPGKVKTVNFTECRLKEV
jgi:hypothetical protein